LQDVIVYSLVAQRDRFKLA